MTADDYELLDSRDAGPVAIRGGAMRTAAFTGSLLLGLLSAPLLVRHLGDADFGRYASVLAVVAIVTGLTEGGINTVTMRSLAGAADARERDRIMADLLGLRLILSTVGIAIAVGFAAVAGYGGDLVLGTLCAAIGMLLSVTQSLLGAVLQARLRFGVASAIEFARGLLTVGLIIVLVLAVLPRLPATDVLQPLIRRVLLALRMRASQGREHVVDERDDRGLGHVE